MTDQIDRCYLASVRDELADHGAGEPGQTIEDAATELDPGPASWRRLESAGILGLPSCPAPLVMGLDCPECDLPESFHVPA